MSTTSERLAEAFKRATGEEVDPPKRLAIMRGKYTLDATPGYGGGRYVVIATAGAADSLNVEFRAKTRGSSTSVTRMEAMLREARARARALVLLSYVLGANGWHVSQLNLVGEIGLQARKGDSYVQVFGDGSCRGYDASAVRFAGDAFAVALEHVRRR
jgi:hypothetical protein